MKTRLLTLTIFVFTLAACAGTPARPEAGRAPRPAQTIAVPGDDSLIAQRLRQSLAARGWTLTRYDPTALQERSDYVRIARTARYRLTLSAKRIGACRDGSASFLYNVALIENVDGHVELALTGANCMATVVERFEDELDRKQLTVAPNARPAR